MKIDNATRRAIDRSWNCQLVTRGRSSGQPRTVTIWFAVDGDEIVLAGGPESPHWYRNLRRCEDVQLSVGRLQFRGRARAVEDAADAEEIRQCFLRRYLAARLSRPFGGYTRSVVARVAIDQLEES